MISLSEYDVSIDPQSPAGRLSAGEKTLQQDIAVSLQDVSLTYNVRTGRGTARQAVLHPMKSRAAVRKVEAVRHVTFDIKHGAVLGVLGHNGAGKSTLLRTISGILRPTTGRIEVHGHVSTLLSIGLGFNAQLSGRDNVVLGGLASGMTMDEIEDKYSRIAEFSELGDFIDLPISTYSSGMVSRLGFSVAVHMEPDILLIDEALSAGDSAFKEKAAAKISELMSSARTIILVSHALSTVQELCNEAILLDHGNLVMQGNPHDVVARYNDGLHIGSATMEDL